MFCFDVYAGNRAPFVRDGWLYLGLFHNVDYEATSQLTFVSFCSLFEASDALVRHCYSTFIIPLVLDTLIFEVRTKRIKLLRFNRNQTSRLLLSNHQI